MALLVVLAMLAFAARLAIMVRGGGLLSIGAYDDGVYYSAADALLHGHVPYRDFLLIQPPGVLLAALPFAWIGTIAGDPAGFVAGRIAFMIVGAVSTVLIAVILRRFGFMAAAVGGAFYAVSHTAAYTERSILLEPIGTLGILIALVVLSRPAWRARTGWLLLAGLCLGVACGFKIWYVVPAAIIVVAAGRGWWRVLVGVALGGAGVYLPFFVGAPAAMFRQVVLDQVGRGESTATTWQRIHMIVGDYGAVHLGVLSISVNRMTAAISLAVLIAMALAVTMRGARLYVLLFVAGVVVLLLAPSFFAHYVALTMPMLALVVGAAAARLAGWLRMPVLRAGLATVLIGVFVALNTPALARGIGTRVPDAALQRAAASVHGCIMTDDPTILIPMNALSRQLTAGCLLWPDLTAWTYDADRMLVDGHEASRVKNLAWQKRAVSYLSSGAAVILMRPVIGLDRASETRLTSGRLLFDEDGLRLYAMT